MEYRIKLDWREPFDDEDIPGWMQTTSFVRCACNNCFSCNMGKTNDMENIPESRKEVERKYDEKVCTVERVDIGNGNNIVNFVKDQEWKALII